MQTSLQSCQKERCQQGSLALVAVLVLAAPELVTPARTELGALCPRGVRAGDTRHQDAPKKEPKLHPGTKVTSTPSPSSPSLALPGAGTSHGGLNPPLRDR